jgi:membrane-bound ClpP family serine protease
MYIGGSLILLTIGAVLAFAVEADRVSGIDLAMVGYIFMAVGALGLIISLVVSGQHRGRVPPR